MITEYNAWVVYLYNKKRQNAVPRRKQDLHLNDVVRVAIEPGQFEKSIPGVAVYGIYVCTLHFRLPTVLQGRALQNCENTGGSATPLLHFGVIGQWRDNPRTVRK
jgi:hypothetical protein